jgi:hypothetical protein
MPTWGEPIVIVVVFLLGGMAGLIIGWKKWKLPRELEEHGERTE